MTSSVVPPAPLAALSPALLTILLSFLFAGPALAQDAMRGTTDAGRAYEGTLTLRPAGAGREAIAVLRLASVGERTLRLAVPASGAVALRVVERDGGPGLAGLGGTAPGPAFALVRELSAPGFVVSVEHGTRGAYFRKVKTAAAAGHLGLSTVGQLPRIVRDPSRQHEPAQGEPPHTRGPLDRPSIYLGGRAAGHELDCGLTFDRVYDPLGRACFTDRVEGSDLRDPARRFVILGESPLSIEDGEGKRFEGPAAQALRARLVPDFAFRPFWRTINSDGNTWHQPAVGASDNIYLQPGERFAMSVVQSGRDRCRLVIRGLERGAGALTVEFRTDGFGRGLPQAWKRVSSIDQFREVLIDGKRLRRGNEGRDVLPTRCRALGGSWSDVFILGEGGARTPLTGPRYREVRGGDTAARYASIFVRTGFTTRGGESLDIVPPAP